MSSRPPSSAGLAASPGSAPAAAGRPSVRGLLQLLSVAGLRRLAGVRLLTSFGDGAFQGALAGAVLFSPERAASAGAIAAGFAVLLLPYSIIGPFAGALLDRWSRRQVIVVANLARCVVVAAVALQIAVGMPWGALFGTALLIVGIGRFVGSGLSASLPHTIAKDSLVAANALTQTAGSVATALGAGYAILLRGLLGRTDGPMAVITLTVVLFYGGSALLALGFARRALGPDETDEPAEPIRAVLEGFVTGLRHIMHRPTVRLAIGLVVGVRFAFGLSTLLVLLLFRHYFTVSDGVLRAGLGGIGEVLFIGAAGLFLGAVVTAPAVRLIGRTRYLVALMVVSTVVALICGGMFTIASTLGCAFALAFAYQSSKVCVDSVVQADCDDAFVGRVFALYDTASNICYVAAFAIGVTLVPFDGRSPTVVILIAAIYLAIGLGYAAGIWRLTRRR